MEQLRNATYYPVYFGAYLGFNLQHHLIFVRTDEKTECGKGFHVQGNLQRGMSFTVDERRHPKSSMSCEHCQHIGWVLQSDMDEFEEICRTIPPPAKQFEGAKALVPRSQQRNCQTWVAEAIDALRNANILQPEF